MASATSSIKTRLGVGRGSSTSLDKEWEEFEKAQTAAVNKAINSHESACKEKHIRTTILGTHRERAAGLFWANVTRLPLEGHPIVAWKFCHVFHKLMREGHPHVLTDSMKYRTKLSELGRLWGHLREGYGKLILHYCKLLVTKLEFHSRNSGIPGNLVMSDKAIDRIGAQDMNNWYQLAIEMLDYMDEILDLQRAVFNSLDMSRANSMTSTGQCRLAPLILSILDSSCLYDYLVKMLFKLHAQIPQDVLSGHRDRFNAQFKQLKQFYYSSSNLQYFKYLVSIPTLPDDPPNFLIASEFNSYVTPKVILHGQSQPEAPDTPPDSLSLNDMPLVDVGGSEESKFEEAFGQQPFPAFQNGELHEKEEIINTLRHDLEDANAGMYRIQTQYQSRMDQFQNRILQLEHELVSSKEMIEQLSEENERFRGQAEQLQNEKNQQTAAQLHESEKKAQSSEEKFKKMKDVYAKLREEHIETLKKQGSVQKELEEARKELLDSQDAQRHAGQELSNMKLERSRAEEMRLQSASEAHSLTSEITRMEHDTERLIGEIETQRNAFREEKEMLESEIERLRASQTQFKVQMEASNMLSTNLFGACCCECSKNLEDVLEQFENPAHLTVTCTPDFVLTRTGPTLESLDKLSACFSAAQRAGVAGPELLSGAVGFCHLLAELILHGKATSNAAPADQMESLTEACRITADSAIRLLGKLKSTNSWSEVVPEAEVTRGQLESLERRLQSLAGRMGDVSSDELGDMMEKEMKSMDQAIQAAAAKIQEIMIKRKEEDTGVRLEVNEKILAACTSLMQAVMILVQRARDLQSEIVAQGKGTGSVHEFYKRHHQWTEGLLSAAKAVGVGANVLVSSADRVVSGEGKFEELMAASQEIAASTAQLVVASKVKADRGSQRMAAVSKASKGVTTATASVLGTVKSGQETLTEKESLDFSKLSLHQSKQAEMNCQVRVLELETMLEGERKKLGELRKHHYHLAGPAEGWEQTGSSREGSPSK